MQTTLFFLRSSEQKIVTDMLHYAARLDETGENLDDRPDLHRYDRHYGLSSRDLGVYILADHALAGAAWLRLFRDGDGVEGFVDDATPVLCMAVKPPFRNLGIGRALLQQLLYEAGALHERISAPASEAAFLERFGFELDEDSGALLRGLTAPAAAPAEKYDVRRWMD